MVRQHAEVLEDLVHEVAACLREGNPMQHDVGAWFWAGHEAAEPGVEGEGAEEAEGGAAF